MSDLWTYVLVTPDGVLGGLVPQVVERLRQWEFVIGPCQILTLDRGVMKKVYLHEGRQDSASPALIGPEFPETVWDDLYRIGPALLIVLVRPAGDAAMNVRVCKGPTLPEKAGPNSVRSLGENRILNTVHSPDGPIDALEEMVSLVGRGQAEQLLAIAHSDGPDLYGTLSIETAYNALPSHSGWDAISFPMIANRVRWRGVGRLALKAHQAGIGIHNLLAVQRDLHRERTLLGQAATSYERMQISRACNMRIRNQIALVARKSGDELMGAGLDNLAELFILQGSRNMEPILSLSKTGVYLSPLEKVLIENHSYAFAPDPELFRLYQ